MNNKDFNYKDFNYEDYKNEIVDYELTTLNKVGEEDYDEMIKLIEEYATIKKSEDHGVKTLAYPILNHEDAHYYYFELKMSRNQALGLSDRLNAFDGVLRYLAVPIKK